MYAKTSTSSVFKKTEKTQMYPKCNPMFYIFKKKLISFRQLNIQSKNMSSNKILSDREL